MLQTRFSLFLWILREREVALRKGAFQVHSANTETQARFEIEMGRCRIFLIAPAQRLCRPRNLPASSGDIARMDELFS
jgi:hypothetical protein